MQLRRKGETSGDWCDMASGEFVVHFSVSINLDSISMFISWGEISTRPSRDHQSCPKCGDKSVRMRLYFPTMGSALFRAQNRVDESWRFHDLPIESRNRSSATQFGKCCCHYWQLRHSCREWDYSSLVMGGFEIWIPSAVFTLLNPIEEVISSKKSIEQHNVSAHFSNDDCTMQNWAGAKRRAKGKDAVWITGDCNGECYGRESGSIL
jgi:hypothetical protein